MLLAAPRRRTGIPGVRSAPRPAHPPCHRLVPLPRPQVLEWTLLNSAVALVGYYFAAFTIDRPWMGRTRMQSMGFLWMGERHARPGLGSHLQPAHTVAWAAGSGTVWLLPQAAPLPRLGVERPLLLPSSAGVLFLICAADYTHLTAGGIHWFQFLYYFSSFWGGWRQGGHYGTVLGGLGWWRQRRHAALSGPCWASGLCTHPLPLLTLPTRLRPRHAGQFGPNATTWLLPAELVPTEMRAQCHGFAAAVGKAGALVAGVVFGLVNDRTKFWISAACGLAGVVVTIIFIPGGCCWGGEGGPGAPWAALAAPVLHPAACSHLATTHTAMVAGPHFCPAPGLPRALPCRHHHPGPEGGRQALAGHCVWQRQRL